MLKYILIIFIIIIICTGVVLFLYGYKIPVIKETEIGIISFQQTLARKYPIWHEILTEIAKVKIDRSFIESAERQGIEERFREMGEMEKALREGAVAGLKKPFPDCFCKKDIQDQLAKACQVADRCCVLPEADTKENARVLASGILYCYQLQEKRIAPEILVIDVKEYSHGYLLEIESQEKPTVKKIKVYITKSGCLLHLGG